MDKATDSTKPNILIVEDDDFLREVYVETLTDEGYAVESAIDGEEGMQKIKQGGYDLVLLDIVMPKMDGLTVIKKIKSEGINPNNKKLIFLTNLDKDEEIREALALGDGYLIKSQLTPGDLIREVKLFVSKSTAAAGANGQGAA